MTRSILFAAAVLGLAGVPAVAAAPTTVASVVTEALDTFCKPFIAGVASPVDAKAKAKTAGWEEYTFNHLQKGGDWGAVNASFRPRDACSVTIPAGSAKGKEVAIVNAAGAWAKKNGYSLQAPRKQSAGPGPAPGIYDIIAEDWARPGGDFPMTIRGYINRRKPGMAIPDAEIYISGR